MSDLKAIVLGGTGAIGQQIVRFLATNDAFNGVLLLSRRQIELDLEGRGMQKVEQRVINFDEVLEKHEEDFRGASVVFCALGTTRADSGADGFYRVDHDYVVNCARAAHSAQVPHFSVVSSSGADANSFFLYPKTKGEMERDIKALEFQHCTVCRPAFLEGTRANSRLLEKIVHFGLTPIKLFCPTKFTIPFESVAKAMIYDSLNLDDQQFHILDNETLHATAALYDKKYVSNKDSGDNQTSSSS